MSMLRDNCEAVRMMDGINYYIGDTRVTRNEFHQYRADNEITDFRYGDSEFFSSGNKDRVFVGHWRSFVDQCITEYMGGVIGNHYNLDIDTVFHCVCMTLREKFWNIDQHNYVYHRSEERAFMRTHCHDCEFSGKCKKDLADVRVCLDDDERKKADKAYGDWMTKELFDEETGLMRS